MREELRTLKKRWRKAGEEEKAALNELSSQSRDYTENAEGEKQTEESLL